MKAPFPDYTGVKGPDPIEFSVTQLRILAEYLRTMGIYSIRQDPKDQNSPIHVQYVNANADEAGSRLYHRRDAISGRM